MGRLQKVKMKSQHSEKLLSVDESGEFQAMLSA